MVLKADAIGENGVNTYLMMRKKSDKWHEIEKN